MNIVRSQFEHLSNSHSTSGHQFKYEPVTDVETPEDNLINDILINDLPLIRLRAFEYLPNHCRVTWIRQVGLRCIYREVEKGSEDRIAILLGRLGVILGQRDKKREDFFRINAADIPVTKSGIEVR